MSLTNVIIGNNGSSGYAIFPDVVYTAEGLFKGAFLSFSDTDGASFCTRSWIEEEFVEDGSRDSSQFMLGVLHANGFDNLNMVALSTLRPDPKPTSPRVVLFGCDDVDSREQVDDHNGKTFADIEALEELVGAKHCKIFTLEKFCKYLNGQSVPLCEEYAITVYFEMF